VREGGGTEGRIEGEKKSWKIVPDGQKLPLFENPPLKGLSGEM
jgi:hypothetical protein